MIGKIIGNYKIEQKLGEGGMGAVYKGVDTMLDREVAIKALRPELASQTSIVERFRSEAVTLAKLHHPNIATLYSLFRQGDELYMVLEFVRGETLECVLQKRGALPAAEVIPVFCQILDGINHAHEFGVIHRDIKPANMMLTEKGTLKVLDFGIARLLGSARMTRAGNIIGTLEYMAPEQVRGQETDARSDIYALGMMLYEMLTGRTPFESENEFELMKLQTVAMPPPPQTLNPAIPEEVASAIMTAIQKDPDARFQTAGDFRESLLDAGFNDYGKMRRSTTGDRQSQTNPPRPSQPPVSQSVAEQTAILQNAVAENRFSEAAVQPHSTDEIKETRLGGANSSDNYAAAFAPVGLMKETRLGASNTANTNSPATNFDDAPKSLFANLTWIHYAGASFTAVTLLGLLVIVPVFLFSGSGSNDSNKLSENKSANNQIIVTHTPEEARKPQAASTPGTSSGGLMTGDNPLSPSSPPLMSNSNTSFNSPPKRDEGAANTPRDSTPSKPGERVSNPPRDNPPSRRNERASNPQPRNSVSNSAPPKSSDAEERLRERRLIDH